MWQEANSQRSLLNLCFSFQLEIKIMVIASDSLKIDEIWQEEYLFVLF